MTAGEDEVGLTVTDVKEELTDLLRVTVADPKWSKTQLLELPIAERQFEASRQYGLRLAQANLNLAVCLLLCGRCIAADAGAGSRAGCPARVRRSGVFFCA
jgi:hypothetical protein